MLPGFGHRLVGAVLLLSTAVMVGTAAIAQDGVMFNDSLLMDDDMLTMLDTDTNSILSGEEYSFYRDRLFNQTDANHDGSISAHEYAEAAAEFDR